MTVTAREIDIEGYTLTYVEDLTRDSGTIESGETLILSLFYQKDPEPVPPITITANSAERAFNGAPLTDSGLTTSEMPDGVTRVEATVEGSQTEVGSSDNAVTGYSLWDGGNEVTKDFAEAILEKGILTVTPATLNKTVLDRVLPQGSPIPDYFYVDTNGFVVPDGPEVISGLAIFHTDYTPSARAGESFKVELTGLYANNYDIEFFPGWITVVAAESVPPGGGTPGAGTPGNSEPGAGTPGSGAETGAVAEAPDATFNTNGEETPLSGIVVPITPEALPLTYTMSWSLINLMLTIATALITALMYLVALSRRERIDEYEDSRGRDRRKAAKNLIYRLFGITATVIAVILFVYTQDMRLRMVFTDKWTVWHEAITATTFLIGFLSYKGHKEEEDLTETV